MVNGIDHPYGYQGQEETDDPFGFNMVEFKWRMHDPAIGRFIQIDPLAEDYNYQSPYNFAENRVIDGFELEGLEWVDSDNNLVYDVNIQNEDGTTGGYTEHATQTHKNLGKSLNQTDTGKEQFNKLVTSSVPTTTEYNMTDSPVNEEGVPILGKTSNEVTTVQEGTLTDLQVVDVTVISSEITFYDKNIMQVNESLNDNDLSTNIAVGRNGKQFNEGTGFSAIVGAVFGHEIEHTTKANALLAAKGLDTEELPTQISDKIIDETNNK